MQLYKLGKICQLLPTDDVPDDHLINRITSGITQLSSNGIHDSSTEHEIKTEKCLDTCQHKTNFVLTFNKNDVILVKLSTVALYFGLDIHQIKLRFI